MDPLAAMIPPHAARAALYRLEGVRVRNGARIALDVPDLTIARGTTTVVAGPNGAGKTTLLRLLAFLAPPDEGRILFEGTPVADAESALFRLRRRATLVTQSPFLFHGSVGRNVAYGLRARGVKPTRTWIEDALASVGLSGFADRPARKLSGGESQRVAIARALAIDVDTYLFDEPTANVDRRHAGMIESLFAGLRARGKTVVLATHDREQARRLGDHTISLDEGHAR